MVDKKCRPKDKNILLIVLQVFFGFVDILVDALLD